MKKSSLTYCLSFLVLMANAQEKEKDYSEAFTLIEVWLEAQKDYESLPGITAAILNEQSVAWEGAFGWANIEDKLGAKPSTIFSICSISKLFTSVAIMKLHDEGKLRLDDRVDDLLPWYNLQQQFSDSWPITVRTLLTHSAGLPRESDFPYWTGPDYPFPTREEIRSKLGDQQTLYPSSTYFQYSNLGLTLLGEIVEEVSGISYDEYISKNILEPLDLQDTRTELPKDLYGKQLAIGYSVLTRDGKRENIDLFQANGIKPAAGFSSNVSDLGKFAAWQFRLLDSATNEILKPSTLKYMHNVHWTDPDWETTWGLGFSVSKGPDGNKWVGHGGYCPGYQTTLKIDPKNKRAYSVMINANGVSPNKYVYGIDAILNKVNGNDSLRAASQKFKEYTGFYSMNLNELYLSTWEGQLVMLRLPSNNPTESMTLYKYIDGDTFRRVREDEELGEPLIFERNEKGDVYRFKRHQVYYSKMPK